MYAFLTAPIGFYSQFLFGQYDSFTVFLQCLACIIICVRIVLSLFCFLRSQFHFKYFPLFGFCAAVAVKREKYMEDYTRYGIGCDSLCRGACDLFSK